MNTKLKEKKLSTNAEKIAQIIGERIRTADKVIVGGGAGLTASAGFDYNDAVFFEENYKPFYITGFQTVSEAIGDHWYLSVDNARAYWGFWANHINTVFYSKHQLSTYELLYDLICHKNYFIVTTNVEEQFLRGGYDLNKIFSMQGSYGSFQCQHGCTDKLYDNKKMIAKMLDGFDSENLMIREKDIPICPVCGGLLSPNIRVDQYFIEGDNKSNKHNYWDFLDIKEEKVVFLELGVGFNTPGIIRYPFEEMTKEYKNATLVRVNKEPGETIYDLRKKMVTAKMDIHELLELVTLQGKE